MKKDIHYDKESDQLRNHYMKGIDYYCKYKIVLLVLNRRKGSIKDNNYQSLYK